MAELTTFCFQPGTSLIHKLDVRFKLLFLILTSLAGLGSGFTGLALLTALVTALIVHSRLPLKSGVRELRLFLILLLLILIARMFTTPGTALIEIKSIVATRSGLISGVLICWRLIVIALLGFLFIFTTPPSEIKAAVEWFLNPVAFVPGKRIAVMMGLTARFIPVILSQARETAEAQRARCVESRKNPLYRLMRLGVPLIRRTFEQADRLILAMQARCYSENRTDPVLSATRADWIALSVIVIICGSILSL